MNTRRNLASLLCLSAAFSLGTSTAALAAGKDTYAHKMEIGQLLYFNGDVDRAIKAFQRAAELNEKAFEPHLNLVNLYVQKGGDENLGKASEECVEVLKRRPNNKEVHLILGNLLRTQAGFETDKAKMNAKLDEALKEVSKAQELGAPEALCENTVGLTLLQKGDMDGALVHIDKALKKQPIFPDAHLVRAVLLFKGVNKVEQKGQDTTVYVDKFDSPEMKKKLEEVLNELDLAIKQKDKNPEAHNTKADILFATGKHADALEHYKKAADHEPRYAQAWAGIGNCSAHLAGKETDAEKKAEHIKSAREAYDKAKRLKPTDKNIVYGLAVMLEKQGATAEAIQEFQNGLLLETDPLMRAQITMHMQQLQRGGLGAGAVQSIGIGDNGSGTSSGVNNIFTNGALSQPFSNLIKIKQPKDKPIQ